jgi:transcriptional regulator GlxA family with amidase domain
MSTSTPFKVLIAAHPTFDTLDLVGPLETLSHATNLSTSAPLFDITIAAITPITTSDQGLKVTRDISISEAHSKLSSYDVLVIPGGGSQLVLDGKNEGEPMNLIAAFAALPKKEDGSVRTLLSVCTGSLFLAEAGVLGGKDMKATTHPGYYGNLRAVLASKEEAKGKSTEVVETTRFVVNGINEEKQMRILTAGGVSCGIDASLWLVESVAGKEVREKVEWIIQHTYVEGVAY